MRVLLCKIHFPFICFCRSSSHIYSSGSLKLANIPHDHRQTKKQTQPVAILEDAGPIKEGKKPQKHKQKQRQRKTNEIADDQANHHDFKLRSSLRKAAHESEPGQSKKVQWLDFTGKELAVIKEFESSEAGDSEVKGINSKGCVCSIL